MYDVDKKTTDDLVAALAERIKLDIVKHDNYTGHKGQEFEITLAANYNLTNPECLLLR